MPCNYQKNFHWNEYVLSQCEKQFRKPLKRLLELIQWDLFSEVDNSIDFIFKIQSSNDESKEIANNKLKADTYVTLTDAGIISPEEARKALAEDEKSGFNSIDVDNVPEPVMAGNEDLFSAYDEFKEEDHKRDENGRFSVNSSNSKSIEEKIKSIHIDFNKDNTLPNLNKETIEEYGLKDKPVLLKKNIIDKNKASHPDISDEEGIRIIGNALYKPEVILKANKDKSAYHNFITRTDDKHNDIVLLELSEQKENYEIVNYHIIDNKARTRKENIHKKS